MTYARVVAAVGLPACAVFFGSQKSETSPRLRRTFPLEHSPGRNCVFRGWTAPSEIDDHAWDGDYGYSNRCIWG